MILKIPYSFTDIKGKTQCYELTAKSEIEVEYMDGSKKTISTFELINAIQTMKSKSPLPNEIIINVKVFEY